MNNISGILFDLDGVLYMKEEAVKGAVETINAISDAKIPFRCLSDAFQIQPANPHPEFLRTLKITVFPFQKNI